MFTVYIIRSTATPKVYIGITKRKLSDRWQDHKEIHAVATKGRLYAAMRKYGIETFSISELACGLSCDVLGDLEKLLIAQFDSFKNGYNATTGGASKYTFDFPLEARERMRLAHTGRKQSAETIARRTAKLIGRKGHVLSEEAQLKRKATIAANGGIHWTDQRKIEMSQKMKGRIFTPEWKAKISEAKRGKSMTERQLEIHRNRRTGWKLTDEQRAVTSRRSKAQWAKRRAALAEEVIRKI